MKRAGLRLQFLKRVHCTRVPAWGRVFLCAIFFCSLTLHAQENTPQHALQLMQAGRFHDAEIIWRALAARVSPHDPSAAAIHANLGLALAEQGELGAAAAEYRKSLSVRPHQPEVSLDLALAEFKQGNFAEAIPQFKLAGTAPGNDSRITILLGMSYFGLHEYASAVPYLQKATRVDPSNVELHSVLAESCLWSKQYDCALAEFKNMLTISPDSVQAHMMLAEALDAMSRKPEAITELETAEKEAPNEPMLHFELGYLYYTQRNYDRAKQEFELEIKNNPGYAQAYAYLADIAIRSNDDTTAAPLLAKAIQLQKDLRLAYFDLGVVDVDEKRNEDAVAAFQRAEQLDPSQPDAHYRLARVYMALGEKEKADQEFATTRNLHTKSDETLIQKVSGGAPPAPKPAQ
jgi:tetratricopeptide (TPR) repeat protein